MSLTTEQQKILDAVQKQENTKALRNIIHSKPNSIFPLVGSGASQELPSWNDLLSSLIEELRTPQQKKEAKKLLKDKKYLELAELLEQPTYATRSKVTMAVQNSYGQEAARLFDRPPIYDAVACLPTNLWGTVNFDPWLGQAIQSKHPHALIKSHNDADAFNLHTALNKVLYLHGMADIADSIVLSKSSFDYLYRNQQYKNCLLAIAQTRSFVFIGHSFSDIEISRILDEHKSIFDPNNKGLNKHFYLCAESDSSRILDMHNAYGLNVIEYRDHKILPELIRWLATPPQAARQKKTSATVVVLDVQDAAPTPENILENLIANNDAFAIAKTSDITVIKLSDFGGQCLDNSYSTNTLQQDNAITPIQELYAQVLDPLFKKQNPKHAIIVTGRAPHSMFFHLGYLINHCRDIFFANKQPRAIKYDVFDFSLPPTEQYFEGFSPSTDDDRGVADIIYINTALNSNTKQPSTQVFRNIAKNHNYTLHKLHKLQQNGSEYLVTAQNISSIRHEIHRSIESCKNIQHLFFCIGGPVTLAFIAGQESSKVLPDATPSDEPATLAFIAGQESSRPKIFPHVVMTHWDGSEYHSVLESKNGKITCVPPKL